MTYDYDCTTCKHQWEAEQRITEDALKVCPACGAETARRLISGGNFQLSGSGWANDGYSSTSRKSK